MYVFASPAPDPGTVLSAIHRVFHTNVSSDQILSKFSAFDTKEIDWTLFEKSHAPMALINHKKNEMYVLRPTEEMCEKIESALRDVPSVLLNELIVKPILNIDLANKEDQKKVTYVKSANGMKNALQGEKKLGFWLRPLEVSEVIRIAEAGHVLPQKSTFFYPKVLSGLVFHKTD